MLTNHFLLYLLNKENRMLYRSLAVAYDTSPWVICRLINGKSIRSEKELHIYLKLVEGHFTENRQIRTGF